VSAGEGAPAWHRTLSPDNRQVMAAWVVKKLSECMHRDEILKVLTAARKLARKANTAPPTGSEVLHALPPRPRGKPGTWAGTFGKQMVVEVELGMRQCGMGEEEALEMLLPLWRDHRFPEKSIAKLRRAYWTAAKHVATHNPEEF
jgi:hypothetical protein